MLISIGQAAAIIGVAISTLRRWELEGRFLPICRTKGGHRRYCLRTIEREFLGKRPSQHARRTIAYARVSSSDQKLDLKRQIGSLQDYCTDKSYNFTVFCAKMYGRRSHENRRRQQVA